MNSSHQPGRPQSMAGNRLRRHADYQRAYAAARKRQSASMSWFLSPHHLQAPVKSAIPLDAKAPTVPRLGLTVGKVLGKAHERNRIKRRLRDIVRRHLDLLPAGCDLILHPRRSVLTADFRKLEAELVRILSQAQAEAARIHAAPPAVQPRAAGPRA